MNDFELKILLWIQEVLQCAFLDFLFPLLTRLGDGGVFWIIVALVMICTPKYRKLGATIGLALLLGFIIGNLTIKPMVARIRPYDLLFETYGITFDLLVERLSDFSFPSGHTLCCFEAATVIFIDKRKFRCAAVSVAVAVALSRLYLFVHYPTDVLFGAVLGIVIAFMARFIVDKSIKIYKNRKS